MTPHLDDRQIAEPISLAKRFFLADLARENAKHTMSFWYSVGTRLPVLDVADSHLAKVVGQKGAQGD